MTLNCRSTIKLLNNMFIIGLANFSALAKHTAFISHMTKVSLSDRHCMHYFLRFFVGYRMQGMQSLVLMQVTLALLLLISQLCFRLFLVYFDRAIAFTTH